MKIKTEAEARIFWLHPGVGTQGHLHRRGENSQERKETFPGFLDTGAQSTVIPTPVGEVLAGAKVRLGGTGDANVDGMKVHIGMKTGVSGPIWCEVVTSPLPDCITGMETG